MQFSSIIIFLFLFVLLSCKNNTGETTSVVDTINIVSSEDPIEYLDDFTESYHFKQLYTGTGATIKKIDKLFLTDSNIVVYDLQNHHVLIFDSNGKFVSKINKYGNGVGTHSGISDVAFDYKNNLIELLDLKQGKIFTYDLRGKAIENKDLKQGKRAGLGFLKYRDKYIFNRYNINLDGNRIALFENVNNEVTFQESFLKIPRSLTDYAIFSGDLLNVFQDSLYYFPPLDNYIYVLNEGHIAKRYQILKNGNPIVSEKLLNHDTFKSNKELFDASRSSADIYSVYNLFIDEDIVFFNFSSGHIPLPYSVFYSQSRKKAQVISSDLRVRNHHGFSFVNFVKAKIGDFYVVPIYPKKYRKANMQTVRMPEALKHSISSNNDSPILMYYRLKK